MGQCVLRIPGVTKLTGVSESLECPRSRMGKLVAVSKPRRDFQTWVTINIETGKLGDGCHLSTVKGTGIQGQSAIPREEQNGCTYVWASSVRAAALERTVE